jgi:hypothetical protein
MIVDVEFVHRDDVNMGWHSHIYGILRTEGLFDALLREYNFYFVPLIHYEVLYRYPVSRYIHLWYCLPCDSIRGNVDKAEW